MVHFPLQTAETATVDFIAIDTDVLDDEPEQFDWLNETLRTSIANWIIVYGHHPIYSTGYHGEW